MNFLTPAAFVFAAALPVVVLFYMLKRRRTVKLVSSTLLWQKFLAENQANAPFQKLRNNWLLILQLLLLALAILALARPYFAATTKQSGLLIVILDGSASMQAKDESPTRFEAARKSALGLVDGLKDTDQMIVLLAAGNTVVKQSPTGEKASLRRALEDCQPGDTPTRVEEAFKLAETLARNRSHVEVHLFSDGAIPAAENLAGIKLPVTYHRFGQRGNNVGIAALDVRAHPDDPKLRAVFASVYNATTNTVSTTAELRFNGRWIDSKPLSLVPRDTTAAVFTVEQTQSGVYTLEVKADDDLPLDNTASIVSKVARPVKLLLVTPGNRFLERALRAVPNVELSTATQLTTDGKGYDVVVLDTVSPQTMPAVNTLAIHVASTNWFDGWRNVEAPAIVDSSPNHPLMRFVVWDNVQVAESLGVKTPIWGQTLLEAQQTPLIIAGEKNRQRIVWVGFDTLQSTWPLRISYPIFMANAVDWLNPQKTDSSQLAVLAGHAFRYPLSEAYEAATVTLPGGEKKQIKLGQNAKEVVWGDTAHTGQYHLALGTNDVAFTVNLMDPAESDITPKSTLAIGQAGGVKETAARRANLEYWRWFAAAALAFLFYEWWYYNRRTA